MFTKNDEKLTETGKACIREYVECGFPPGIQNLINFGYDSIQLLSMAAGCSMKDAKNYIKQLETEEKDSDSD